MSEHRQIRNILSPGRELLAAELFRAKNLARKLGLLKEKGGEPCFA